ncbi:hypothetical protein KH5_21840 [Urechidicola sp. KH5]
MKKIYFYITLLSVIGLSAQEISMDLLKNMAPRNIGPSGMSGRITAIDVVESNTDIMYVGTASGGLWKSNSGGITWEPIFDNEITASIGAVAIQQSNPSVIWVGTGEGNPRNSLNGGYGIFKSIDGGKSWKSMGLKKTRHIHRVVIDPTNPNIVYAGAIGSPWGIHEERGVYKTTDGGVTWNKILYANPKTGVADLIMDPKNPNKLIAAMWEHYREPWFFKSGGKGSGLHITYDGGDTWKKMTEEDGFPKGELGRIGVAIAPSEPNTIYAIVEAKKNALYKSSDGGSRWKMVNNTSSGRGSKGIGNRPFYYSEIYVDPTNENRLYSIYTYVNVSEDGGKSFSLLMPAYNVNNGVHPDHHAWWIHPTNGKFMIDGNDGGLNITKDGGKTWRFIGNIPVAQFYHINIDNEYPYNVYGGMQDNGSWRGPAHVWKAQGIRNSYWQEISFGDGFDVIPDRDNSRYGWSMSQQGYVVRYDHKTGNNYSVKPNHPDPNIKLRFNWNSAINIHPQNNSTIYFGSQFVHKSTDKGETWTIISPDLTSNDPEKQMQHESGGLTMDATGAENHCSILVIEPSPIESNMLWVGTDDGKVHITQNEGGNWKEVTKNIKGLPEGAWVTQIKASNKNKGEALLVANDYRRFNYEAYVFRTKNYGKSWERLVDSEDVESFALSIIEDPIASNLMFLGTDDGLYMTLNAGETWQKWTEGFPTVPVKDLVIHPREHDLVIGTFGRAAWVIDDIRPLRALADSTSITDEPLTLFKPPTAYKAAYQQPTGSRFGADAMYQGENKKSGAHFSYFINVPTKENKTSEEKEAKSKLDSITLEIYNKDLLIRTLKRKAPKESGIQKFTWYLDEKGGDRMSRTISKQNSESGGTKVKAGSYKAVLTFGSHTSETTIVVKEDPRLQKNSDDIASVYNAYKQVELLRQTGADAVKQLVESKTIANDFTKKLKEIDKEKFKEQINSSKDIIKQIDSILALYIGKEDKRQGITKDPYVNVNQRISTAMSYVSSRQHGITATEEMLIKQAKEALEKVLITTNEFFESDWPSYQKNMESLDLNPFKEIKQFKLK